MASLRRSLGLAYGLVAYAVSYVAILYGIGFLINVGVPKGIDDGAIGSLAAALAVDVVLLGAFAVQHSVMARASVKERLTAVVPSRLVRSTYVLLSGVVLLAIFALWRPLPTELWSFEGAVAWLLLGLYLLGWTIGFVSTFLIDHLHLFGIRHALAYYRDEEPEAPTFQTPLFYRYVRHPLLLGFILAFWATPTMTVGHLLFAAAATGYCVVGAWLEERDMVDAFGDTFREYQREVPMFLPRPWRKATTVREETGGD